MRKPSTDRRKVNVPVGDDKRGTGKDKRQCPLCHSALQNSVQSFEGGTWTTTYCVRCEYRSKSKQIDEGRMQSLLGFEAMLVGTTKKPMLELHPQFLKFSGAKPGDTLEVRPLFTPGGDAEISWIVKKILP
jgi:hypothetical protein